MLDMRDRQAIKGFVEKCGKVDVLVSEFEFALMARVRERSQRSPSAEGQQGRLGVATPACG